MVGGIIKRQAEWQQRAAFERPDALNEIRSVERMRTMEDNVFVKIVPVQEIKSFLRDGNNNTISR